MRLYSVGYGNRSFEEFCNLVLNLKLTHVVDVRSVPYSSYQTAFRRENLAETLPRQGLKYVYMGDTLGGATVRGLEEDAEAPTRLKLGLDKLAEAAANPSRHLCLMCGCLLPNECHRGLGLGAHLQAAGFDYWHVGREGELFHHDNLVKLLTAQPNLFEAT